MSVRGTVTGTAAVLAGALVTPAGSMAGPVAGLPGAGDEQALSGTRRWWRAWRARFGLAEVCGSVGAAAGFAAGYRAAGSLVTAAELATIGEFLGFYGCVGTRTVLDFVVVRPGCLAGWGRLVLRAARAVQRRRPKIAAVAARIGWLHSAFMPMSGRA